MEKYGDDHQSGRPSGSRIKTSLEPVTGSLDCGVQESLEAAFEKSGSGNRYRYSRKTSITEGWLSQERPVQCAGIILYITAIIVSRMIMFSWILVFVLSLYVYYKNKRKSSLPPGPWNLPLIGSLHRLDSKAPHISLTKLARKYGPIYTIKLGLLDTVVISDAKLLKKVLMKDEALARPPLYLLDFIFRGKGVAYSPIHVWKHQRKFTANFLRTSGAARTSSNKIILENHIGNCADEFIQYIKEQGDYVTLNPSDSIVYYVTNISSALFLGKAFSRDNETRQILTHNIDEISKQATIGGALNFLPFLRVLPKYKKIVTSFEKSFNKIHEIGKGLIQEVKLTGSNTDDTVPNLIEAFLTQGSKFLPTEIYNEEQLLHLVVDMLGGSIETTVNSLLWILLYLAKYENIQNKVRQELFDVLQGKTPKMDDLPKLPYTEATIAEVLRNRSILPLGFPRYTLDDIEVENFIIPKSTMIMPLLWALHTDPTVWKNPEEFCPDRFLNDDGKFHQPGSFLPFQTGKRMCVGEDLAKMIIFLFISTVLQNFKIERANSSPVNLMASCGITLIPKPQELLFVKLES
ncbi:cytochrome P450 2J6-like [Zophobas morio]|uniref:cytochrome P450 2J6-like n=1 Tax=Zophobas morio TaxID=2755281 RepID=UPI003082AE4E